MAEDMDTDKEQMLAAEYTLGLLDPAEARAFEEALDGNPTARANHAFWAEHLTGLAADAAPVTPPDAVWANVTAALFPDTAATEAAAGGAPARGWLQRLGLLPAMAGGLVAALAVLWVLDLTIMSDSGTPFATATLASADNALVVQIAYVDDGAELEITRTAGDIPAGQSLELWLLKDDRPPISLGLLPADENGTLQVAAAYRELLHGAQCAISIEPEGGSPTGAPTGDVVAVAPIVWQT